MWNTLEFFGAVLLVAVRCAVLATAILVTVFLMAPLPQFGTVKANPGIPSCFFDSPKISVVSPRVGNIIREPSTPIKVDVLTWGSPRKFVDYLL